MLDGNEAPTYNLTFQDVLDILELIDSSPLGEMRVVLGDLQLAVSRGPRDSTAGPRPRGATATQAPSPEETRQEAPAASILPDTAAAGGQAGAAPATGVAVMPPMAGTFYRAPSPGAPPYVDVGSSVREGAQVGIVEVMKLFTPVLAPCAGTVLQILAADEQFVQSDQTLMVIEATA